MSSPTHPACGLYRTTQALESVPAGRLVYFHNHGDPGAGIYLPKSWSHNRAEWQERGITVPDAAWSGTLQALVPEGLYRVRDAFFCCEKRCVRFETGALVQLGYDGEARPLLFLPEWSKRGLALPERGSVVIDGALSQLERLVVHEGHNSAPAPAGGFMH